MTLKELEHSDDTMLEIKSKQEENLQESTTATSRQT